MSRSDLCFWKRTRTCNLCSMPSLKSRFKIANFPICMHSACGPRWCCDLIEWNIKWIVNLWSRIARTCLCNLLSSRLHDSTSDAGFQGLRSRKASAFKTSTNHSSVESSKWFINRFKCSLNHQFEFVLNVYHLSTFLDHLAINVFEVFVFGCAKHSHEWKPSRQKY